MDPPGSKDIYGELLASNKELENWIELYQSKCGIYELTMMYDGWMYPNKQSIINFLAYYDMKTFYKSINTFDKVHSAWYILKLMEDMIDHMREQNTVQVITDNGPWCNATSELLMERQPHIFWTPCATHYFDLMLMDIKKIHRIKQVVEINWSITRFIYNHTSPSSNEEVHYGSIIKARYYIFCN